MKIRFAFVGFRHAHIFCLWNNVLARKDTEIVAACEEDPKTRDELRSEGKVKITHDDYDRMLSEVQCDVVAVGDYYAKRGGLILRALEIGKHVISDKPICTSLAELDAISELIEGGGLKIGGQFDLRGQGSFQTMRQAIEAGEIGDVHTIAFSGQHPLLLGSRPDWYFQPPGCHGGTINDIAVHAMDAIEWISGRHIVEVVAARAWNARTEEFPHFQDAAQLMLRLDNNGGVLGDVSYLAPDSCGYSVPQCWRIMCHGSNGVAETACNKKLVMIASGSDNEARYVPAAENVSGVYLDDFMSQVKGECRDVPLSSEKVLRASRLALLAQQAADTSKTNVPCREG